MSVVVGVEDSGAIPVLTDAQLGRLGPFVPADEDVPHEGALPNLYGLEADAVIEEAIEAGGLRWSINLLTGETVLSVRTE
ncbi:hypothetical protein ACFZCP_14405 [Streptomyces sp. NPDC007971]|uniref:hypothetical protein n=1 Tax=Streptomyces sp. NPDC007971 TaxID=3364799 RepID=UPI0036E407DC